MLRVESSVYETLEFLEMTHLADGVLKNPETYEPFSPEKVGQKREIVIGKYSGKSALQAKYRIFGIEISDELLKFKLEKLRTKAVKLKRDLTDKEILDI